MSKKEKRIMLLVNMAILVLGLLALYLIREVFGNAISLFMSAFIAIVLPFSIALFISYLMAPVFKLLERRLKFKYRILNIVIVFVGTGILLVVFIRFAGTLIYEQALAFIENDWPNVLNFLDSFFDESSRFGSIYNWIQENVRITETDQITLDLLSIFQSVVTIIITVVLIPVFLFFILYERTKIYENIMVVFPKKIRIHAIELTKRANRVVEEYFNGRFITMFVMAVFFTIIFFILGFKERSILFGFMLGFFDIVPYVGPFIAIILPVLYSLTERDTLMFGQYAPIAILTINIVGQMIQNNVAQPLIMGRETKIHPLLILSAFVFFTYLFGIVGLILAIPITGTIKTTIIYIKELNKERIELNKEELRKIREEEA